MQPFALNIYLLHRFCNSFFIKISFSTFYTVVSGWMLKYFVATAKGDFAGEKLSIKVSTTIMLHSEKLRLSGIRTGRSTVIAMRKHMLTALQNALIKILRSCPV